MGIKLRILFLAAIVCQGAVLSQEKFLSIKGKVVEENSGSAITDYTIRVVQDQLDSTESNFSKSEFQVWAPANRRSAVYFIKEGYATKHIYIDASYIPSIAFKEKQAIEVDVSMTPVGSTGKRDFSKPFVKAEYEAKSNSFVVKKEEQVSSGKTVVSDDYSPPFPAPVDTYKGVQPTASDLGLTETVNKEKTKSGSEFYRIIQGILFADMNYCFFNERTNDANSILTKLSEIDPTIWGNLKPFDSPEYGKIIMRTVNREQSVDTLFALGSFVESSRLIFENFTSDSKIIVHLKKLKEVMNTYKGSGLSSSQKQLIDSLTSMVPLVSELEKKYTESLRNKTDFDLNSDDLFGQIKSLNLTVYQEMIK